MVLRLEQLNAREKRPQTREQNVLELTLLGNLDHGCSTPSAKLRLSGQYPCSPATPQ